MANKDTPCSALIKGLEPDFPENVIYCRLGSRHSGHHVSTLTDGRDGWWFGTLRGFIMRGGELREIGGGGKR